jgi:Family of unknown function (DUF7002)
VELIELKRAYPYAWHSTFAGGWERIRSSDLGLASTAALLDHYYVTGEQRERLECAPRAESEWIERDGLQPALIRDQKPLVPARSLERVLEPGISVREWCFELNRRSYFFVSEKPLARLLAAYPESEHDVLVIDARKLADRYEQSIALCAINTGAIGRAHAKRGRGTFLPIADYPTRLSGGPLKPVAEITVTESIVDIEEITLRVERWRGSIRTSTVWTHESVFSS